MYYLNIVVRIIPVNITIDSNAKTGNFFIIPGTQKSINHCKKKKYKKFKIGKNYNSLDNSFLSVAQIKELIKNYKKK